MEKNLDYEFSYGEQIVVTPRNFEYGFRYTDEPSYKYAIIGMAHVSDGYPLYYDAMNEKGLGMAGLNFVGNVYFNPVVKNKTNVCSFEFIPWILCQCETVEEAIHLINEMNLCDTPFSALFPPASLHYMISDSNKTITVESVKQKSIKTYKKKTNLKISLNNLEKNRIIEYYSLVNLETSKPDFLRNSIADSSVKTCCFIGGLGFLNDS